MSKPVALFLGILAWLGVGALAVLISFNIGGKNQVLMFLPILAAVFIAWAIGEVVTDHVFADRERTGQ